MFLSISWTRIFFCQWVRQLKCCVLVLCWSAALTHLTICSTWPGFCPRTCCCVWGLFLTKKFGFNNCLGGLYWGLIYSSVTKLSPLFLISGPQICLTLWCLGLLLIWGDHLCPSLDNWFVGGALSRFRRYCWICFPYSWFPTSRGKRYFLRQNHVCRGKAFMFKSLNPIYEHLWSVVTWSLSCPFLMHTVM